MSSGGEKPMYKTLQSILVEHIQRLDHDFIWAKLSIQHTTNLQIRNLKTINLSIDKLRSALETLPISKESEPICPAVQYDIYSHLTIIRRVAYILLRKSACCLDADAIQYLDNVVEEITYIEVVLHAYKKACVSSPENLTSSFPMFSDLPVKALGYLA
jgi:hypothetical protein